MPFQGPKTPIGQRRTRVHFERQEMEDDGMGGLTPTGNGWIESGHAFAAVTALDERGRESLSALQIQGRAAYHVDMAYREALTDEQVPTTWRLRIGQKRLEIQSVQDDTGRKQRLILLATETQ